MAVMGQGVVLMVAGMGIVYLFLYVLIVVTKYASAFVVRYASLLPDEATKRKQAPVSVATHVSVGTVAPKAGGTPVKAPVPGTVLRVTATEGLFVKEGDELLVMDVMKMETPITAPCAGIVSINVAVMDKVNTGDVVATVA